jgi:hypothetical protein
MINSTTKLLREGAVGTTIFDVVVTEEMFDACEMYADDVTEVVRETRVTDPPSLDVEGSILIHRIHEKCFGTPDAFLYDRIGRTLYIWDFKYGHLYIDEFENWQTITYVAGIMDLYNINEFNDQNLRVVFRIVQPRAYGDGGPIREWSVKGSDLRRYINILNKNAHIALSSEAVNHTGSHCRYCGARHICPDALKAGLSLYEATSKPTVQNLSLEALGTQYSIIERAKEQIGYLESGFQEQIKHLLKSGKNVPGYVLTPSIGRERWNRPESEVITMGEMMGQNLSAGKAITPNQARKKHVNESIISMFSERPNNGVKLVKSNTKQANKIFLTEES